MLKPRLLVAKLWGKVFTSKEVCIAHRQAVIGGRVQRKLAGPGHRVRARCTATSAVVGGLLGSALFLVHCANVCDESGRRPAKYLFGLIKLRGLL